MPLPTVSENSAEGEREATLQTKKRRANATKTQILGYQRIRLKSVLLPTKEIITLY
jgi:hypothetical protein